MDLKFEYSGTIRERCRNPVYMWLTNYNTMTKNEIINHIRAWEFNQEGTDLFEAARDSDLIKLTDRAKENLKRWDCSLFEVYEIADRNLEDESRTYALIIEDYIERTLGLQIELNKSDF